MSEPDKRPADITHQLLPAPGRSVAWTLVSLGLVGAVIVTIHLLVDWQAQAARLNALVQELGTAAPLLFVAATAAGVAVCAPIPVIVGIGAVAFGQLGGAVYSLAGIVIGTALAFLIGRYVLRDLAMRAVERRVPAFRLLAARHGPLPAIGLRLVFPFTPALDYAVGAAAVRLPPYLLGSFLGLLPRVLVLSFFFTLVTRSDWMALTHSVSALLVLALMPLLRVCGIVLLVKVFR